MKTEDLKREGFTVLAFTTTHQIGYKKARKLRLDNINFRTRATTNFITEYYTKTQADADVLYKVATNLCFH